MPTIAIVLLVMGLCAVALLGVLYFLELKGKLTPLIAKIKSKFKRNKKEPTGEEPPVIDI